MPQIRSPLGLTLVLIGVILIIPGAVSVWLGTNGIVINRTDLHFGPTTTAEIANGWIMISVATALFVAFAVLFFTKRSLLSKNAPHFT
jgi:hypothetical protein